MKITVFGAGYVGLVTAACLSDMGNSVVCVDVDAKRVDGWLHEILGMFASDSIDACDIIIVFDPFPDFCRGLVYVFVPLHNFLIHILRGLRIVRTHR